MLVFSTDRTVEANVSKMRNLLPDVMAGSQQGGAADHHRPRHVTLDGILGTEEASGVLSLRKESTNPKVIFYLNRSSSSKLCDPVERKAVDLALQRMMYFMFVLVKCS